MTEINEAKQRIKELIKTLNSASEAYYDKASEIISNLEYDRLYDELLMLEDETGIIMSSSPSQNVGYEVQSALPKEKHQQRMLSLNKTKSREELKEWLGENEGMLSWKLDGLTVVLTYNNGKLAKAVTRGNGDVGEVITANAQAFENVPYRIPYKGQTVIRGEAVIKYSDFERINHSLDEAEAKYKNPRNLCSGSVRQLDSRITAERNVNFYAFALKYTEDIDFKNSRKAQFTWMKEQGFTVVEYKTVNKDNIFETIENYAHEIEGFDVPSDGLVLSFDDISYAESLGTTAKFPKDSIAFKWQDQLAETTLREIVWSPSRTGLLNPVAVFDSVELEGTTVSRASVHNISIMEELQLGIGDTITVYKANMIIPQIGTDITKSGSIEIPRLCPVCGGKTEIISEKDTKTLVCSNPDCIAKQVKSFSLFVSRDAMNIEGLSESTLLKFIGMGFIKMQSDIFDLKIHKEKIIAMDGFGVKSYEKLIQSIDKSRQTTPARLLYSLGIPGIGVTNAAIISKACRGSWDRIASLKEDELLDIEGVGNIMAADYLDFFNNEKNKNNLEELLGKIKLDETYNAAGVKLDGMNFVITGILEQFSNRKELKTAIENEGGKVTGTITGKTDYLITNNTKSGSGKNKKARELDVKIIDEDEIIKMLK